MSSLPASEATVATKRGGTKKEFHRIQVRHKDPAATAQRCLKVSAVGCIRSERRRKAATYWVPCRRTWPIVEERLRHAKP